MTPQTLETIYNKLSAPIERRYSGISPRQHSYSHLCQTNVKSYAITGSWRPFAITSHTGLDVFFKIVTNNTQYSIDNDAYRGDNDLQVNVTSQLDGLKPIMYRQSADVSILDRSEVYPNTVHSSILTADPNVFAELNHPKYRKTLLVCSALLTVSLKIQLE